MENDPETEFEFFLAQRLGRTVAELRAQISQDEFVGWSVYYGRESQRRQVAAKGGRRG